MFNPNNSYVYVCVYVCMLGEGQTDRLIDRWIDTKQDN